MLLKKSKGEGENAWTNKKFYSGQEWLTGFIRKGGLFPEPFHKRMHTLDFIGNPNPGRAHDRQGTVPIPIRAPVTG